jgi:D-tyrosyl-tRNA(Tyr) deacylase
LIALVQRVREASVEVAGQVTGQIGPGLLILLGIHHTDTPKEAAWLAKKCAHLRIFPDDEGRMNRSLLDTGGAALVVSQFTLYGDTQKGHRPSFVEAAPPEIAIPLYDLFVQQLSGHLGQPVPTGVFGAMMQVRLQNDGPVTLWLEKRAGT